MAEKKVKEEKERVPALWSSLGELEPWPGFFGDWPFGRFPRLLERLSREWPATGAGRVPWPALDVAEDDANYTITVELPGCRKEDVHVELQESVLTVHGEKRSEREEKKERSRYVERSYGSFSRSFRLPGDADADRLQASYKDGVLTLTLPKSEEAKPRTIAIKSA